MRNYIIYDCIGAVEGEAEIVLQDNVTDFQLRWIQYATAESPAWLIDEIYITCTSTQLTATKTFEETDRLEALIEGFFVLYCY